MKNRLNTRYQPMIATLTLLLAASLPSARADEPKTGWNREVLFGVGAAPEYAGSSTERVHPLLGASFSYVSKDYGVAGLGVQGLYWTFLNHDDYHFGIAFSGNPGRIDHRENGILGARPGSDRLAGMGDVAGTGMIDAYGDVQLGWVSLGLRANRAVSSYKGSALEFTLSAPYQIQAGTTLVGSVNVDWIDDKTAQAFFGVTNDQAAHSRFAAYTAKAGIAQTSVGVVIDQELTKNWKLMGVLKVAQLQGDAGRSPLVQRKTQSSAQLGMSYSF